MNRNLLDVLHVILAQIGDSYPGLRKDLKAHYKENLYRAPEVQNWRGVAKTLKEHLDEEPKEVKEDILKIWRDEG